MFEKRTQQRLLRLAFSQRLANSSGQMLNVVWNKVGQIGILGPVPHLLIRIKFRCVCGKPFDTNSFFKSLFQPPSRTAVNHPAIPDQNNTFEKMLQQGSDKRFGFIGRNVMVEQLEIQSHASPYWRSGNSRDNREPIPAIPTVLDRSFATGRPCTPDDRLKHKTAFIHENDGFTAFSGVFLSAASGSFARQQWPLRRVREPVVRASGNSIPSVPIYARRRKHRRMRQSVFGLPQRPGVMSKDRWNNPAFRGFAVEAFPDASTGWRSVWGDGRYAGWISEHPVHAADRPFSTVKPQPASRRNAGLLLSRTIPVPATSWRKADAAPYSCMTSYSSYKTLSAKPICLIELFNGQ